MKASTSPRDERGFALIIIVLLVAILALVAATLLDLVALDLSVSGDRTRRVQAQFVAEGGVREVIADTTSKPQLPGPAHCSDPGAPCPDLRYDWVDEAGGVYTKNPDAVGDTTLVPTTVVNQNISTMAALGQNYTAKVDHIKTVAGAEDSSHSKTRSFVYGITVDSEVYDGDARHQAQARMFQVVTARNAGTLSQRHRR